MHVSIFNLPTFNFLFPIPFRGDSFAPGSVSSVDSDGNVSTSGIVPVLSSAKLLLSASLELVPKNGILY